MSKSTTSLRLDDDVRERLARLAKREGASVSSLIERLLREGILTSEHPGIVFKSGRGGRRATLAGGPDIWAIASALRFTTGSESERIAALAEEFGIHERQVAIALDYIAANSEQIESEVVANDKALADVERIAAARKRLLA